jgi:hypothetical protein
VVLHVIGCESALESWAKTQKRNRVEGKPLSIMKVAATEEWRVGVNDANKATAIGGGIQCAEEIDWTFYTDYFGDVLYKDDDSSSLEWKEQPKSGVDKSLLTDTSVPILFFDEV